MSEKLASSALTEALESLYQDPDIRERSFYPDFRRGWDGVFRAARESGRSYLPEDPKAVYTLEHSWGGVDLELHFDQLKMADWYAREINRRSQAIFVPKKLRRNRAGVLSFHESVCRYEPEAAEPALTDDLKNIIACALPGLPPELAVVYGNKWVNSRFTALKRSSLNLFLLNTDYVPAFLGDPWEVGLYLFLMDCCIVKENFRKVKDEELRPLLHIFRPSPMLVIKGLVKVQT